MQSPRMVQDVQDVQAAVVPSNSFINEIFTLGSNIRQCSERTVGVG